MASFSTKTSSSHRSVRCIGQNSYGELGIGRIGNNVEQKQLIFLSYLLVRSLFNIKQLAVQKTTNMSAQAHVYTVELNINCKSCLTLWCIGFNALGEFGIGNDNAQKQLMKCGWSEKIQIRNIYTSNRGYTVVEDMNGNYYSAGWNGSGACTVNDKSKYILNMTPITYFKQNNIKISQVFVSNYGDAPFWKTENESIYTSCSSNYYGCAGVEVDRNKLINKI
eukprot:233979_1